MTIQNVILFVFAAISIPLYLAILITLIRYRKEDSFKSAFFKIFISLGIISICQTLNSYFTIRWPMFGYFKPFYASNQTGFLPKYACFTVWYFVYGQFLANLLLAINRYTAFRHFWVSEDQIWTPRRTRFAYLLPWILPIFIAFYCWFQDVRYVPQQDTQNNTLAYIVALSDEAYMVNTALGKLIIVTVTVITCTAYAFAVVNLRKIINLRSSSTNLAIELRLMVCALLIFVSMLIYVLFQIVTFVTILAKRNDLLFALFDWWFIVGDQFTLINAWLILATSQTVRHKLLNMFAWRSKKSTIHSITVNPIILGNDDIK